VEQRATTERQSLGDLVRQLTEQASRLAKLEVELARAGLEEKGRAAKAGAGAFGVALVLGLLGLGALTACAVLALTHVVDDWLAALIVGAVELTIAGIAALVGRSRVRNVTPLIPEESVRSVRADVEAVKPHREATS
jgi:cytochrome c biogenesis protein CcdA